MIHHYLIALGSNQRHPRYGAPAAVLRTAIADLDPLVAAPIIESRPFGPSQRRYANSVVVMASTLAPDAMLADLKALERHYGRRRRGQKWRQRVLDLDIILWSGGLWASPGLGIPHQHFRHRRFVLAPAVRIAATWRDPVSGLLLCHLFARLDRKRPHP
ncbi:MAG: 2-amino-4-hydroxy-6-hydroxymethyldihydropteridine diphosphokinase [Pseudomonadota bacterium]